MICTNTHCVRYNNTPSHTYQLRSTALTTACLKITTPFGSALYQSLKSALPSRRGCIRRTNTSVVLHYINLVIVCAS